MAEILVANIPEFTDPANPERKIKLNEATVRQAIMFSGLNPDAEEKSLSAFLNEVQDPAKYTDSREWTAQTRKLALFWYAVQTMDDAKMSVDYECPHCDEWHTHRYDLRSLADGYADITGKAYREFDFNGQLIRVSPLNGHAMENLEEARSGLHKKPRKGELTEAQEDHNRQLEAHIRLRHLALSIDLPNDTTEDPEERFKRKEEWINALTVPRQLEALKGLVYSAQNEMRHGLDMASDEFGELHLFVGSHVCPNKQGEGGEALSTPLRTPFRDCASIPVV